MSSSTRAPRWAGVKKLFWPIQKSEHRKIIPMLLIYFLIVFNYSILKAAKDALLITAPGSGANAIPYIKLWAILPMALLTTLIFTRLSNKYSRDRVFYSIMSGFLIFFFLFAFVLYPLREVLHPHALAEKIVPYLPKGLGGLVAIFRNWTFTLFYVMCELWGTLIMSVLFWGFANEVTSVNEAKRFYSILGVGANLGTILAAYVGILLSSEYLYNILAIGPDRWTQSLMMTTGIIIIVGLLAMLVYRRLTLNTYHKEIIESRPLGEPEPDRSKPNEIKMGIRKNFAYLAKSKYLICIAVIVLTYNISLNMIEIVWKDQAHHLFPYAADLSMYMNEVLAYIGILSTLLSIFVCGQVVRRFGWTVGAYLTPLIMLVTGVLFFLFTVFQESRPIGTVANLLSTTPLVLSVFFGSLQNCLARASKFTFFDVTKEMSFIPLSKECKLKGKAAIDGVGSRLGKSGGSLIHQVLLVFFGTISLSTPFIGGIFLFVIVAWLLAVKSLGKQFAEQSQSHTKITIPDDEAPANQAKEQRQPALSP